ncbi:hypothetical protein AGABI2DRAFT_116713 [Agaricus bisporus var. bisporus H97]|uniref:hypothetical protein n=1 Tax=Agaricus bisporus var. bisporus (strain H97 / ATCC MYA-4626 / FGSC 10389) TaxID=936046 RepID=UPI00029F66AC|nr:hypothetical protein AGABI2DRAFT_116713 [Agaricus bisporus var. bisporus H97]EKV47899.1 hypothetical protein AGABI2DRAFT_116713 [Agaricus bisporus var. bisporus H97]
MAMAARCLDTKIREYSPIFQGSRTANTLFDATLRCRTVVDWRRVFEGIILMPFSFVIQTPPDFEEERSRVRQAHREAYASPPGSPRRRRVMGVSSSQNVPSQRSRVSQQQCE